MYLLGAATSYIILELVIMRDKCANHWDKCTKSGKCANRICESRLQVHNPKASEEMPNPNCQWDFI